MNPPTKTKHVSQFLTHHGDSCCFAHSWLVCLHKFVSKAAADHVLPGSGTLWVSLNGKNGWKSFRWSFLWDNFHLTVFGYRFVVKMFFEDKFWQKLGVTVARKNPAPIDIVNILLFSGFYTSPGSAGFLFHQNSVLGILSPPRTFTSTCSPKRPLANGKVVHFFLAACQIGSLFCTDFMRQTYRYNFAIYKVELFF